MSTKSVKEEFALADEFFTHMDSLRRAWNIFHPVPPLKRSDLALINTVQRMQEESKQPVTVGSIAFAMKQTPPGISKKVSLLEEKGYVKRKTDKQDRRIAYISLTEEGERIAEQCFREFLGRMQEALNTMGTDKTRQLISLMDELSKAIDESRGHTAGGEE